jgi:hypothetical protein
VYWVWTQVFFPLWEAQTQVAQHFAEVSDRSSLLNRLESNRPRLSSRHRMRIVLFADSQQYAATLGRSIPGIEQSTGFYSDERRTSFFYPDDSADAAATRRHELVHQLFREATRSTRTSPLPGRTEDFWLVEGIAGYFESLHFENNRATLGGWDSPRLQFARFRVLSQRDMLPFAELIAGGQRQVQARSDLPRWYAHAIAQTHHLFDGPDDANRRWIYQQLAKLYQVDLEVPGASPPEDAERALVNFLKLDDPTLQSNPTQRSLRQLCLAGCEVTAAGLLTIPPSESLTWLDLSRLPIRTADVRRLCPNPHRLNQLSLEATRVDDSLAEWLAMAIDLQELDLSWTRCGDQTLNAVTHFSELQTVWLTGSNVSDQSVAAAMQFDNLQAIDLQRTTVTAAGLARLRRARPSLKINPLQLRFETGSQ